jgi:hypothetical protein
VDAAASGVQRDRRADLSSVSDFRHAGRTALYASARVCRTGTGSGEAFGRDGPRTAKACGPDAAALASSQRRFFLARPGSDKTLIR